MTVFTQPGWLQNAGAVHSAEQMRNYSLSLLLAGAGSAAGMNSRGGVHPALGNEMQVTQTGSPSMAILVKSGLCAIPGTEGANQGTYGLGNDGDVTIAITAAHATLPRIDLVIARIRDSAYSGVSNTGVLEVVAGTPNASPVTPSLPANSLALATVAVAALATTIVDANITDVRSYVAGVGGFIRVLSTESLSNRVRIGQPAFESDTLRAKVAVTETGGTFRSLFTAVDTQIFTSSGTWNKPAGAERVFVQVQAGGGAGGGAPATIAGQSSSGGGGGGGAYGEEWFQANVFGSAVTVTIGAGGAGVSGAAGNNGGASTFGAHVTANGGTGGVNFSASANEAAGGSGAGGTVGTADLGIRGSDGGLARRGASGVAPWGGYGGSSHLGASVVGSVGGAGTAGRNYGGGGAGAAQGPSSSAVAGGSGANGVIIVTTFK